MFWGFHWFKLLTIYVYLCWHSKECLSISERKHSKQMLPSPKLSGILTLPACSGRRLTPRCPEKPELCVARSRNSLSVSTDQQHAEAHAGHHCSLTSLAEDINSAREAEGGLNSGVPLSLMPFWWHQPHAPFWVVPIHIQRAGTGQRTSVLVHAQGSFVR